MQKGICVWTWASACSQLVILGESMYHRKDIVFAKPSIFVTGIEEYACRVSSAPSEETAKVAVETAARCPQWADIASNAIQVKFLAMLVGIKKARRVLEIGTFTGHA